MNFPVTAHFNGGEDFTCVLNHEIDCTAGYEVCLNDIIFTGVAGQVLDLVAIGYDSSLVAVFTIRSISQSLIIKQFQIFWLLLTMRYNQHLKDPYEGYTHMIMMQKNGGLQL